MTELSFNPYFNGYSTLTELAREQNVTISTTGFNPCFNGYSTLTFRAG